MKTFRIFFSFGLRADQRRDRAPRLARWYVWLSGLLILGLVTPDAPAGSGRVNSDGTIDMTVNLRYPPTAAQLTNLRNQLTVASRTLWDASEGQLRLGNITLSCGAVNEDLADIWAYSQNGRAGVGGYRIDGSALGERGKQAAVFANDVGEVIAHELGHLALGLGDEYVENNRCGGCWGFGQCMDGGITEQNQCLMQQPGGFSWTEFCTDAFHDPLRGSGVECPPLPPPAGCTANCRFYNTNTMRYETTQQTDNTLRGYGVARSCWAHLVANFPFLRAPAGLPVAAAPAGFVGPNFIERCADTDTVLLILDRSGSMGDNTERDFGEVCGDGVDNDGDGMTDETSDCTQTRLAFLKAAARAWLQMGVNQGVRVGIVSFNESPRLDASFRDLNTANLPGLTSRVDNLMALGGTGIGTAIDYSAALFDIEAMTATPRNPTAFLISDGENTDGGDPLQAADRIRANQGVRVLTISTGGASRDATLSGIAGRTGGSVIDARNANTLVNAFAQQFARYRNQGLLVPILSYALNGNNQSIDDRQRCPVVWGTGGERALDVPDLDKASGAMVFCLPVEPGTEKLTLVFAGNMGEMAGFGLSTELFGPPGTGPSVFNSEVPDPLQRVVRDAFFLLVEITAPNPGTWTLFLRPGPGAASIQTGNLTAIIDNPQCDLFASLDRTVVDDPLKPVRLSVDPLFYTPLVSVNTLTALVKRPDGAITPVALASDFELSGNGEFAGLITDMPFAGVYEVRVFMHTGPGTVNNPGETIYAPAPPNSVIVPELDRNTPEYFFVKCPPMRANAEGGNFALTWRSLGDAFVVEAADEVNGPWADFSRGSFVGDNTWKLAVAFDQPHRFFRLKCAPDPCLDVGTLPYQTLPNPWNVRGYQFAAFGPNQAPWTHTGVFAVGQFGEYRGFDCGFSTEIQLPIACERVELTFITSSDIQTFARGYENGTEVASDVQAGPPGQPRVLALDAPQRLINRVVINAPGGETYLIRICCK